MQRIYKEYYKYKIRFLMRRLRYYQNDYHYITSDKAQNVLDTDAFERVFKIKERIALYNNKVKMVS